MKATVRRLLPGPVRSVLRRIRRLARMRLAEGPLAYNQDGLATVHNADFIATPRFARAYAAGVATGSWKGANVQWRAYVACWAADIGSRLEGDFVECGVNRGGLSRTLIDFIDFARTGKHFYLLDTYEGLVDTHLTQAERDSGIVAGRYEPCFDAARRNFAQFAGCTTLIQGTVPETLSQVPHGPIAYLSIDMNCVGPEIAAAEHFWPQMSAGAIMLLDDYGWPGHIEQKKAFDAFAASKGALVLPMPTGQGIIIKP
jgi:O-methyltransferase